MKDVFNKIKGQFKIELLDDNNKIVDSYSDNNLIMDLSKIQMAQILGKLIPNNNYINEIRLGGEGIKLGTVIPKDSSDGFTSVRTKLFAEQNGSYVYSIKFEPTTNNGDDAVIVSETDTTTGYNSIVNVTNLTNVIKFTTTIPKQNGNHGSVQSYSEAGLYMFGNLFAMKLFPPRLKTSSLKMVITWSIVF